jgi:hypothetical protein
MIMSQDRIDQEHAMLNRLVVGLLDDGTQVVRIVPTSPFDEPSPHERAVSLAKRVATPMPVARFLRNTRTEELLEALEKIDVEAFVTFGKDAEQVAHDLAKHIDVPILQEVISMRQARRVKKSSIVWRWLAATPTLEQFIANKIGVERVALVPLGAATSHISESIPSNANTCISVLDATSDFKATRSLLEALEPIPNVHIFMEFTGKHQAKVWKEINQRKMQDRVTCMRDMADVRSLITQSDLVLVPSKSMQMRTILLEVMLASIPIISTKIEGFDMLIDQETALIVDKSWQEAIQQMLNNREFASRIGKNAACLINEKYASAVQIAAFEASFTLI